MRRSSAADVEPGGAQRDCCAPLTEFHAQASSPDMPGYGLAHDIYACLAGECIIFADLRTDKYIGLNRLNTQAAVRLLTLHTAPEGSGPSGSLASGDHQLNAVARALTHKGLIVKSETSSQKWQAVVIRKPEKCVMSHADLDATAPLRSYAAIFLLSALIASARLRFQPIRRTIRQVENRRLFCASSVDDLNAMFGLVTAFHRLRPYYAHRYLCRFDSLALLGFLAHYGYFPRWVFGVRLQPFGAHCWVQHDDWLLNDSLDYVKLFTPIMVF